MLLRPLVVGVDVLLQPAIACRNALFVRAVVHVIVQIRDDEANGRQLVEILREVREPEVRGRFDSLAVRHVGETDPGHMLTRIQSLGVAGKSDHG
jgi:hypothetical protein